MKKSTLLFFPVLFNLIAVVPNFAQAMHPKRNEEGFYLELEGGYGQGNFPYETPSGRDILLQNANLGICAGYKPNKHIGLELKLGDSYEWAKSYVRFYNSDAILQIFKLHMLSLQPGICFNTGRKKLKFYSKSGILVFLPVWTETVIYSIHNGSASLDYKHTESVQTGILDFILAAGGLYDFNSKYALFAGIRMTRQLLFLANANYRGDSNAIGIDIGLHLSFGRKFLKENARYDLGS